MWKVARELQAYIQSEGSKPDAVPAARKKSHDVSIAESYRQDREEAGRQYDVPFKSSLVLPRLILVNPSKTESSNL